MNLVDEANGGSVMVSEEIRSELKKHKRLTQMLCLECGYNGLVGVLKSKPPWYLTNWVLIPLMFLISVIFTVTGGVIGFVAGLVVCGFLGIMAAEATKTIAKCPFCGRTITQK